MKTSSEIWKLLTATVFILTEVNQLEGAQTLYGKRRRDPRRIDEFCRNFTVGHPHEQEFYSPLYPHKYPEDITCFRVITADIGYFVRIDFRDVFQIEPMNTAGECEYDFLEIRDGEQGYSPLIGKYCGSNFPPMITSSGRSLWLRFKSDSTIQYKGFKAVFSFIENPLDNMPDIGKCSFEGSGYQEFIGSRNISTARIEHSKAYDVPIDCVWTITVEEEYRLYIQFNEYELSHPNDCHVNYIQIYDGKTDQENKLENFCGSIPDSVTSKTNVVFVRFYAEKSGIKSKFSCTITRFRPLQQGESCDPEEEYDCDDATCIHRSLICNGIRNCKFGWDEEACQLTGAGIEMDLSSPHAIIILAILILILLGMFAGMMWNLYRNLQADKEELRERSLAASSRISVNRLDPINQGDFGGFLPTPPGPPGQTAPVMYPPNKSETALNRIETNGGCYVPDARFPATSSSKSKCQGPQIQTVSGWPDGLETWPGRRYKISMQHSPVRQSQYLPQRQQHCQYCCSKLEDAYRHADNNIKPILRHPNGGETIRIPVQHHPHPPTPFRPHREFLQWNETSPDISDSSSFK